MASPQPGAPLTKARNLSEEDRSGSNPDPDLSSTEEIGIYSSRDDSGDGDDEVDHARKVASKETARLRFWRFVVTDTIVMIATVLILTTYTIRREAEHVQFQQDFEKFATVVSDRVKDQQHLFKSTLLEFASVVSTSASTSAVGAGVHGRDIESWPFESMPIPLQLFEKHAQYIRDIAPSVEGLGFFSIVRGDQRQDWLEFADMKHEEVVKTGNLMAGTLDEFQPKDYHSFISRIDHQTNEEPVLVPDWDREFYFPALMWSPPPLTYGPVNWNMASDTGFDATVQLLLTADKGTQDEVLYTFPSQSVPLHTYPPKDRDQARTYAITPVYRYHQVDVYGEDELAGDIANSNSLLGIISAAFLWDSVFANALPHNVNGIVAVLKSSSSSSSTYYASNICDQVFSFQLNGQESTYLGPLDMHDPGFDKYMVEADLIDAPALNNSTDTAGGHCAFTLQLYPSSTLWDEYVSFHPEIYAMVSALLFFIIAFVYFVYDQLVDRRNEKLVSRFARSNAIVSSLFPKEYRERLMGLDSEHKPHANKVGTNSLKAFMSSGFADINNVTSTSKPLADLFPEVSILFSDINGFTAWASVREPNQVFTLLETLYSAFDDIATTRRIFKVETVGDCYVAAAGLPDRRKDHAVALVRFARDILQRMQVLTKELEVVLGPDTGDLSLRTGIHSGPVTAGILRGKKARFQLFGDSMNTCSRLESTGLPGRIHISQATAKLLRNAGKNHWVHKRTDLVTAKGKGVLQTYWVTSGDGGRDTDSTTSGGSNRVGINVHGVPKKTMGKSIATQVENVNLSERINRLVEWNLGALLHLLKEIVSRREAENEVAAMMPTLPEETEAKIPKLAAGLPLDEVVEVINIPEFNRAAAKRARSAEQVEIPSQVVDQLRTLIRGIASMYRNNPFHNFEHASHVTMSVTKLLSRIVAPTDIEFDDDSEHSNGGAAASLHDHTYGITSDPLTQWACIFSALIHDVDHTGVPNAQLVKEEAEIASYYQNRSVAEQNSFDLSWALFMDSQFDALRATVCPTAAELIHFRELVLCSVLATDIADKDLKQLRNARWQKAFDKTANTQQALEAEDPAVVARLCSNRKATIVIEHLLQASDVAHTMQHWHIYRKWNEKFFRECFVAYKQGRAATDPREHWYKGEIGFFDFYIIPLAKKLKECGVFGVSSDEYLIYAQNNRDEWEARGKDIVAEMVLKAERDFDACIDV